MKNYLAILLFVVFAVLIGTVAALISDNAKKAETIERISGNLSQYKRDVSYLNMTTRELRDEVEKGNQEAVELDSLLRSRNMRITQLERYIKTSITIKDSDTVLLVMERGIPIYLPKMPVKYKSNFVDERPCFTIKGYIVSEDESPELYITEKSSVVEVYDVSTKRRWWQFWKPRTQRIVTSPCGDVKVLEVEKHD